jgi:hypothetical protein
VQAWLPVDHEELEEKSWWKFVPDALRLKHGLAAFKLLSTIASSG